MSYLQAAGHRLRLRYIGPGSAYILGLMVAVLTAIVTVIVLSLSYLGLDYFGVVSSVNTAIEDLMKFTINFTHVLWLSAGLAVLYLIVIPVLFAVSAWIYNLGAGVTGGLRMRVDGEISDI